MLDRSGCSDLALLRAIGQRDAAALRALFDRYAPAALALAQRVIRDPMLAEDVVQEAFLAVWERPDAYRADRGSVRAFLFRIVHNRSVDRIRREMVQQRRVRTEAELGGQVPPALEEVVTDSAEAEYRRGRVRAALTQLPAEQRRIIEMMYFDGLTQVQVAERLELPLGTVKSRTLLGMRKLRAAIGESASEPPR